MDFSTHFKNSWSTYDLLYINIYKIYTNKYMCIYIYGLGQGTLIFLAPGESNILTQP